MLKKFFMGGMVIVAILTISSCGSNSNNDTDTGDSGSGSGNNDTASAEEETQADGSIGATVMTTFSGLSQNQSVSEQLQSLIQKGVIRLIFTACDSVNFGGGPDGITMSLDGTDGTYGASANPLVVAAGTDYSFCSDGGEVAVWEIPEESAVEMSCTDSNGSFTATMSGSGIFVESDSSTLIRGNFDSTVGNASVTTACSFDVGHSNNSTFENASCDDVATIPNDVTCTPPEGGEEDPDDDGGPGEGPGGEEGPGDDNGPPTCTTDAECQGVASNGVCSDGVCDFLCTVDADCDELSAATGGQPMACFSGHCGPAI